MKAMVTLLITLILVAGAVSQTSGPAAAQPAAGPATQPSAGRSCFWIRDIQNFRSVDNRTVYVRVSRNDVFALELFSRCHGVDWARNVGLRVRSGNRVCEGRANWVYLSVRRAGGGRQRCSVSDVRRLTPTEVASLPRGARP